MAPRWPAPRCPSGRRPARAAPLPAPRRALGTGAGFGSARHKRACCSRRASGIGDPVNLSLACASAGML